MEAFIVKLVHVVERKIITPLFAMMNECPQQPNPVTNGNRPVEHQIVSGKSSYWAVLLKPRRGFDKFVAPV
jgi:hypothetical protein